MPDPFTGEILNVGIAIEDENRERTAKVIEWPGRLTWLYGEEQATMLVRLAEYAAHAFEEKKDLPAESILISDPKPFYNMTAEEALEVLFRDQVTVAIPRKQKGWQNAQRKTRQLRQDVYSIIRSRAEFMPAPGVIPERPYMDISTDAGPRRVLVPLRGRGGVAGLESANYSASTVNSRLHIAIVDLEYAARSKGIDRLGLFIGRSAPFAKDAPEIYEIIEGVRAKAPPNCTVEVDEDLDVLTTKILRWAA